MLSPSAPVSVSGTVGTMASVQPLPLTSVAVSFTHDAYEFIVLFMSVWRIWSSANILVNRFHPEDVFHKAYFFLEMVTCLGMVVHTVNGVVGSYLTARGITEAFSAWAAYH